MEECLPVQTSSFREEATHAEHHDAHSDEAVDDRHAPQAPIEFHGNDSHHSHEGITVLFISENLELR